MTDYDKTQENQRHLLLIGCSRRKRPDTELLPALERYDGNTYRLLRKLQRECQYPESVDILVLSAEFGLLKIDDVIPNYERRMDRKRASKLRSAVLADLQEHLNAHKKYGSVYIDLGKDYLPVIDGIDSLFSGIPITFAQGRIGQRLHNLKQWLLDKQYQEPIVPFFVADRPFSLKLLKGLPLREYPGIQIGIMAHANTTASFQTKLHDYPCEDRISCDAIGGKACRYSSNIEECQARSYILDHTIKMCDSGIFTRQGATLSYEQLFEAYEQMGIEYGIMIDVFQNPKETLESAREALKAYKPYKSKFKLVGVAHGRSVEEYLDSYINLKRMGFTHVAVGGILRRVENSVRYTQVRDETSMYQVLDAIRSEYPHDWLFALGCFHPNRLAKLSERRVWGDYKGWIFRYEKIDDTLDSLLEDLAQNDLKHVSPDDFAATTNLLTNLGHAITLRARLMKQKHQIHKKLLTASRSVRNYLRLLYQSVKEENHESATLVEPSLNHALLTKTEVNRIGMAIQLLDETGQQKWLELLSETRSARVYKSKLKRLEEKVCVVNNRIAEMARKAVLETDAGSSPLINKCKEVVELIRTSESEHRVTQIRENIANRILSHLI